MFLHPANEVWGKVIFLHLSVCPQGMVKASVVKWGVVKGGEGVWLIYVLTLVMIKIYVVFC